MPPNMFLAPGYSPRSSSRTLRPLLRQAERRAGAGRSRADDDGVEARRRIGRGAGRPRLIGAAEGIAPLLDLRDEGRQDRLEVGDVADVGELEDGRPHVPVDGEDPVGLAHAGHVVRRAGDAEGEVEIGGDRPARLPDEPLLGQAAVVDHRPGGAHRALEQVGELAHGGQQLVARGARCPRRRCAWRGPGRPTGRRAGSVSRWRTRGRLPPASSSRTSASASAPPRPPRRRRSPHAGQVERRDRDDAGRGVDLLLAASRRRPA